jgi:hypothetical protein
MTVIHALPTDVVSAARMDPSAVHVTANGGEPVRCCLRDAAAGEELLLINYEPPLPGTGSPYREMGAVWVHASECTTPVPDGYPREWLRRPQVLRAYDERGWIHPATRTHDGKDSEAVLADVLAADGVVEVHSRNIAYGCYMFSVTKD